jgi:hypothetical protein
MAHPEKIDWCQLSENSAAIRLLEANPSKIDWEHLSLNESIFASNESELTAALRCALEFS